MQLKFLILALPMLAAAQTPPVISDADASKLRIAAKDMELAQARLDLAQMQLRLLANELRTANKWPDTLGLTFDVQGNPKLVERKDKPAETR